MNEADNQNSSKSPNKSNDRPVAFSIAGWAAATLTLTAGIFTLIAFMYGGWAWPDSKADPNWIRTVMLSALPTAGVLAGAAAVALTIRRQKTAENNYQLGVSQLDHLQNEAAAARTRAEKQLDRELVAGLRDRLTSSSEQLAHESPAVQLSGIYALAALVDDWIERENQEQAQVCINLLCAFLRNDTEHSTRTAIVELITQRLRRTPDNKVPWSGFFFNLQNLTLAPREVLKFRDISVGPGTTLSFLWLKMEGGVLDFNGSTLEGGRLDFYRSTFTSGRLLFAGSWMHSGVLNLDNAIFGEKMNIVIRPRRLSRGVVSIRNIKGTLPDVVVPPDEEKIRALREQKRSEEGKVEVASS